MNLDVHCLFSLSKQVNSNPYPTSSKKDIKGFISEDFTSMYLGGPLNARGGPQPVMLQEEPRAQRPARSRAAVSYGTSQGHVVDSQRKLPTPQVPKQIVKNAAVVIGGER